MIVFLIIIKIIISELVLEPIVFVGGIGGSQLEAKLTNATPPHWWCKKNTDWFSLWMNIDEEIPYLSVDCFYNSFHLHYNPQTKEYSNSKGVEIRPYDFGGVGSVEYLSNFPLLKSKTAYMHNWIVWLEKLGYKRGVSFRVGSYDWRYGPDEAIKLGIYEKLKKLVEDTYEINDGKKVHLMGHSNGAPYFQYFLAGFCEDDWKEKYISSFISLGGKFILNSNFTNQKGPYDGSPVASFLEIIGWAYYQPFLKPTLVWREILKTIPGVYLSSQWLIPSLLDMDKIFLNTSTSSYSYNDYERLLKDANSSVTYEIYLTQKKHRKDLAPGVKTHCIYGQNIDTPSVFYIEDLLDPVKNSEIIGSSSGDSTVLDNSLYICDGFKDKQSEPVYVNRMDGAQHVQMVFMEELWKYVWNVTTYNI